MDTFSTSPQGEHDRDDFASLMAQVRAGSEEAVRVLVDVYGPHLLRAVRGRLHHKLRAKFDSRDFVQDVWASFFAELPRDLQFDRSEDLIRFLARIARNKVVDAVRQRMKGQKYNVNRERPLDHSPGDRADNFPAHQPTPSTVAMDREDWDRVLKKADPLRRHVLLLLRDGKSREQIARELKIDPKTVHRWIERFIPRSS